MYLLFGNLGSVESFDHFLDSFFTTLADLKEKTDNLRALMVKPVLIITAASLLIDFMSYKICCKGFKSALDKLDNIE